MTDEWLDDHVLRAVRAARPADAAVQDVPSGAEAQALLRRVLSSDPGAEPRRPRRSFRRWREWALPVSGGLAATAIVLVALGGLGHSRRAPAGPATPGRGLVLSAGQYVFAVGGDTSPHTAPQQLHSGLVLFRAGQILRARCMRMRGFHYVLDPTPSVSALPSATGYPSTFYPQPVASAYPEQKLLAQRQRTGFGIHAGSVPSGHDQDPDDRYVKTLSPARQRQWLQAFDGRDGCYGIAEVQLFGSRRAANLEGLVATQIYNHLNTVAYNPDGSIAQSNPRTAAAAHAWSRCMHAATGETWSDENALISTVEAHSAQREITLAVADTRCAYSTGQAQAFAAAFRAAANHLPRRLGADLRYLLAHRAGWIRRANGVIASARS